MGPIRPIGLIGPIGPISPISPIALLALLAPLAPYPNPQTNTIMKRLSLILSLLLCQLSYCLAQELDPAMQAYLDFCLLEREALSSNPIDCAKLERCIEEGDRDNFVFNDQTIHLAPNATFRSITTRDSVSMSGHAVFKPWFVDSILVSCIMPDELIDEPTLKRGADENCFAEHRALKAHGKGTYTFQGTGDMQLFVVADNGGLVRVRANNPRSASYKFDHRAEATVERPAAVLRWDMGDAEGDIIVTVENLSDKPVGFVIATN